MKVSEIMTRDPKTAQLDSTLEEFAALMKDEDVGAIPIVDDDDELVGIVTDRDIVVRCVAEGKEASDTTVEDILSEELTTIEPDADVQDAARRMAEKQIRRLPVVEDGELVGMVSIGDISVKHEDDETAGETLQEISRGVKQDGRGKKVPTAESIRNRAEGKSGARSKQGIATRSAEEEGRRQGHVVSIRDDAKAGSSKRAANRRKLG